MGGGVLVFGSGALHLSRRSFRIVCGVEAAGDGGGRWQVLEQVDKELSKGDERAALNLVMDLQAKPCGLRCFDTPRQLNRLIADSADTLDELRLNGIETVSLLSPVDTTLGSIERSIQVPALLGGLGAWNFFGLSPPQILYTSLGLLFLLTIDAGYMLTSLEALKKEVSFNVQAGTAFVDFEFLEEVSTGKVSATTLNKFSCIALAGVATEYLLFGAAEGGLVGRTIQEPRLHLEEDRRSSQMGRAEYYSYSPLPKELEQCSPKPCLWANLLDLVST